MVSIDNKSRCGVTHFIPALGRISQEDVSSEPAWATQQAPIFNEDGGGRETRLSLIPSTIKQNWKSAFFIFMKSSLFKFCYLYFGNIAKIKNEAISIPLYSRDFCLFFSVVMGSARIKPRPPVQWTNVLPLNYTFPVFLKTVWSVSSQS